MKSIKLITVLILALSIIFMLASCNVSITGSLDDKTNTNEPGNEPTDEPTNEPTDEPTDEPTNEPTNEPTDEPTNEPTDEPTNEQPSDEPTDGEDECSHIDDNKDGYCDKCGQKKFDYTAPNPDIEKPFDPECYDADGDGLCDKCGKPIKDTDDHKHSDKNDDGKCDICDKELNPDDNADKPEYTEHEHNDYDLDKICDKCGKPAEVHYHIDTDGNTVCDYCGFFVDEPPIYYVPHEHYDDDYDGKCDKCGEPLEENDKCDHYDKNGDGRCDKCKLVIDAGADHIHLDRNEDGLCDYCDEPYFDGDVSDPSDPGDTHKHYDNNGDALCDECKNPIKEDQPPEDDLLQFDNPRLEKNEFVYGENILINFLGIPDGCTVYWTPDIVIENAGIYEMTFTVEKFGYETFTFAEVITVHKANYDMSDVEFLDAAYDYDGSPKSIMIGGTLPAGVEVSYSGNDVTDSGTHIVTAHFYGDESNYNPIPDMTAKIVIGPHLLVSFNTTLAEIAIDPVKVGIGAYFMPENLDDIYGYTFVGWFLGDEMWHGDKPIESDITLTAKWQLNEYKIVYFTNGGINAEGNPTTYSVQTLDVDLLPATYDGKVFGGWYLDENFETKIETVTDLSLSHFAVYAKWVDPFSYSIENGKATILGFNEPHADVVIPEFIEDCPVVAIANDAFYNQNAIETVYIPDSVTSIGSGAFYYCRNMKTIRIPSNIEYFGVTSLYGCNSIEYTVAEGGAKYLGNETNPELALAYFKGTALTISDRTRIILPEALEYGTTLDELVIPDNVVIISDYALASSNIKKITIESGVKTIGIDAFSMIGDLESIVIPESVTSIGQGAFCGCESLTSVSVPKSVTKFGDNVFSGCPALEFTVYGNAKYLGNENNPYMILYSAISEDITSCDIHEDTKIIHSSAFSYCMSLTEVDIPDGVHTIGRGAFQDCRALQSINIPEGVRELGMYTFGFCGELKTVYLPSTLTKVHDDAFFSGHWQMTAYYHGTEAEFAAIANCADDFYQIIYSAE